METTACPTASYIEGNEGVGYSYKRVQFSTINSQFIYADCPMRMTHSVMEECSVTAPLLKPSHVGFLCPDALISALVSL